MNAMKCAPQKVSKLIIGFAALICAIALFILGITLVPVLGILLSLPTFAMAVSIFRLHLNDRCEIQTL